MSAQRLRQMGCQGVSIRRAPIGSGAEAHRFDYDVCIDCWGAIKIASAPIAHFYLFDVRFRKLL
jgi:hypothetical protein